MAAIKLYTIVVVVGLLVAMVAGNPQPKRHEETPNGDKFYEVDAFGDDFTDVGVQTGGKGAYVWHANYPLVRGKN